SADLLQNAIAVDARKHQIEQHEIRLPFGRCSNGVASVARDAHVIPLELEIVFDAGGEIGVVFDDEDSGGGRVHVVGPTEAGGSLATNRAPALGADSTRALPLCAATTSSTTDNPMPLPPVSVPLSPRVNGRQMRSRSASLTPGPSSSTEISTPKAILATPTRT